MIWKKGPDNLQLTPPHDIHNQKIKDYLPRGEGASVLLKLMEKVILFFPFLLLILTVKRRGIRLLIQFGYGGRAKTVFSPFYGKVWTKGCRYFRGGSN